MKRSEKVTAVVELTDRLKSAKAIILAEYRGLKVSELTEIRREMRKTSSEFKVFKNRLTQKAIAGSAWESLKDHLKGPTALAISDQDPVVLSKVLMKYAGSFAALKLKAGLMGGTFLDAKAIEALSKLPSKEELYAKLLGTLLAPAQSVVRALQGVPQKLVLALKAISEKK